MIDILAIFASVAGVATSLGMATLQMTSGFNYLFGIPETNLVRLIVITIVTFLFMLSAITGLDKGIKILSNLNISLCGILMILGLIIGPTILRQSFFGLGGLLGHLLLARLSLVFPKVERSKNSLGVYF